LLDSALRKEDLVLLDAGFWSYGLLWKIQQNKRISPFASKAG